MKFRNTILGSLCFAIVAAGLGAGTAALAAGEAAIITQRQGVMTGHNDHVRAIVEFLKLDEGTSADVAKHAGGISVTARIIPTLFCGGHRHGRDQTAPDRCEARNLARLGRFRESGQDP